MELNDYQKKAMKTCMPSSENFSYMMLNLVGEVGEFASKVAKAIRKEQYAIGEFKNNELIPVFDYSDTENRDIMERFHPFEQELQKEAGDILWQLAGLCSVMGWDLEDVAQMNLDKLASRQKRNVIDGNGDNR